MTVKRIRSGRQENIQENLEVTEQQIRTPESIIRCLREPSDKPHLGSPEEPGGSNRFLAATGRCVFGKQRKQNFAKRTSLSTCEVRGWTHEALGL